MYKICKSISKTIFNNPKQTNYTKQWWSYRNMSDAIQLLSTAHRQCRQHAEDQNTVLHEKIYSISATDCVHQIEQYDRIEELLYSSTTHMQQIGETHYKNTRYNLINISIIYPKHWCSTLLSTPSLYHKHQNKQREETIEDWYLSALGNCLLPSMKQKLSLVRPAEWSASLQPYAADNYIKLMAQSLAIFILLDDYVVEKKAAIQKNITLEDLLLFADIWKLAFQRKNGYQEESQNLAMKIHGIALRTNISLLEPCFHIWTSICDNFVKLGADEIWCNRMSNAIKEWFVLAVREAIQNEYMKRSLALTDSLEDIPIKLTPYDYVPFQRKKIVNMSGMSLLEFLMQRRIRTIGVSIMSLMMEQSYGFNLSSFDCLLRPLIDIVSMITALANELFSMGKDLKGEPNFSLTYREIFNCSLKESIDFTVTLHDLAIELFDQKAEEILDSLTSSPSQDEVSSFINCLRILAYGYGYWHQKSGRYKSLIAVDDPYKQIFLFSIADGTNQRYNALQNILQRYKKHSINKQKVHFKC